MLKRTIHLICFDQEDNERMEKIKITPEFEHHCKIADTESRGSSFRPFRYNKSVNGKNIPVFFIGVPGFTVAVCMTVLLMITVYMVTLPFNMFLWGAYLFVAAMVIKFALKVDKVRQIRYMTSCLSKQAFVLLEKANEQEKNREKYAGQAKYLLERVIKWVDEPAITSQLNELKSIETVVYE